LITEDALVKVEQRTFFAIDFYHLYGFRGAISGTQTAADAQIDVEDLFASKAFGDFTLNEGIFARRGFLEKIRKDFFHHG
jgi:hypothetical protein